MWKTKYNGQAGFTLLELMIVMSIIGILSVIAIPKFNDAIAMANTSKVQTDLQTLKVDMSTVKNVAKMTAAANKPKAIDAFTSEVEKDAIIHGSNHLSQCPSMHW